MQRLILRFENMPERHAELAWRFGEPDESFEDADAGGQGSRWVLASPLPPDAALAAHLEWASEQLRPHEAFVGELISLGGKVVLHLHHETLAAAIFCQFNARLLLPMAHAGILLEFSAGAVAAHGYSERSWV